jgi:hypothetical protein
LYANYIHALADSQEALSLPSEVLYQVSSMVHKFQHLFQETTTLPPSRPEDHQIPLIPGAQPVNIRPYKYSPQQQNEIDKQVEEMLKNGVIQHSSSPYASLCS